MSCNWDQIIISRKIQCAYVMSFCMVCCPKEKRQCTIRNWSIKIVSKTNYRRQISSKMSWEKPTLNRSSRRKTGQKDFKQNHVTHEKLEWDTRNGLDVANVGTEFDLTFNECVRVCLSRTDLKNQQRQQTLKYLHNIYCMSHPTLPHLRKRM